MRSFGALIIAGLMVVAGCSGGEKPVATVFPQMDLPRCCHTATRLADGRVVLAGGLQSVVDTLPPANLGVEIYDPAAQMFTVVARLPIVRQLHTATLLADGRILLIGGSTSTRVDVFDPVTNTVEAAGHSADVRLMHTSTLLADGTVLLIGGMQQTMTLHEGKFRTHTHYLDSIEIYDPATGTGRMLEAKLHVPRRGHTATLMDDGRVLVIGGTWQAKCEFVDPAAATVTWGPTLHTEREDHRTTRLADGTLLVTGGSDRKGVSLDSAEILDAKSDAFRVVEGRMHQKREDHSATLLPDGRVVITGGEDNHARADGEDIVLKSVELFDPETEKFTLLADMTHARDEHQATLLPDGSVLVTGGVDESDLAHDTAAIVSVDPAGK